MSSDALCARTSEELPRWPLASLASAADAAKHRAADAPKHRATAARRGPSGRVPAALATAMGDDPEWNELEAAHAVG
jgi:hypothetical protein